MQVSQSTSPTFHPCLPILLQTCLLKGSLMPTGYDILWVDVPGIHTKTWAKIVIV